MDVAASPNALGDIWEGAQRGALNFSIESDGKIAFDAPQGFRVRFDCASTGSLIRHSVRTANIYAYSDRYHRRVHESVDTREGALPWRLPPVRVGFVVVEGRDSG